MLLRAGRLELQKSFRVWKPRASAPVASNQIMVHEGMSYEKEQENTDRQKVPLILFLLEAQHPPPPADTSSPKTINRSIS